MADTDNKPTANINIDSKFRRETSNFKIDITTTPPMANEDPDPVLIKYIEKNLAPEDLLGTVVRKTVNYEQTNGPESERGPKSRTTVWTVVLVRDVTPVDPADVHHMYALDSATQDILYQDILYYIPNTGALSLYGAYEGDASEGGGSEGGGSVK